MKSIPRTGWISHGVSLVDVESVAEHSFSTSALSLLLVDLETQRGVKVNVERVLRMALLHDLSESLTFDISKGYLEYIGKRGATIKRELERNAWNHIASDLKDRRLIREYTAVQDEYVRDETVESKIVHAADSLDILLQIIDYQRRGYPGQLLEGLWKERRSMVERSDVVSARRILRFLMTQRKKNT